MSQRGSVVERGVIPATMPPDMVDDFGSERHSGAPGSRSRWPVVFLASAESSDVTGERIGVHGGMPLP